MSTKDDGKHFYIQQERGISKPELFAVEPLALPLQGILSLLPYSVRRVTRPDVLLDSAEQVFGLYRLCAFFEADRTLKGWFKRSH